MQPQIAFALLIAASCYELTVMLEGQHYIVIYQHQQQLLSSKDTIVSYNGTSEDGFRHLH